MNKNHLFWSDMDEPDMVYYLTDLYNQMVFDRGKIRPDGKIHFKNAYQF